MREESPFTPRSIVPVDLFMGREGDIQQIVALARQSSLGRQEHLFLFGERGIGKTSLARYSSLAVEEKTKLVPVYVSLGGVETLEELVRRVFEEILRETKARPWFDRIQGLFGKYITQVGAFSFSLGFRPPEDDLKHLVSQFPEAVQSIVDRIAPEARGLFIVFDDINGLCRAGEFANWFKSLTDKVAFSYEGRFPVGTMLVALPEMRTALVRHQPSVSRVFTHIQINQLSQTDVETFYRQAFESRGLEIDRKPMQLMVGYSGGLPSLMQEIGDAVYGKAKVSPIPLEDVWAGIKAAAIVIGNKYLGPGVYDAIKSKRYRSILRKLGEEPLSSAFAKKDLGAKLNDSDKKVLHNFLTKMVRLGLIVRDPEEGSGSYRFVNLLYALYIQMESALARRGPERR